MNTGKFLLILGLLLSAVCIYGGTTLFDMGFHTLDRGWNSKLLNEANDLAFIEHGFNMLTGEETTYTDSDMIHLGNAYYKQGFMLTAGACILFGACLGVIANLVSN